MTAKRRGFTRKLIPIGPFRPHLGVTPAFRSRLSRPALVMRRDPPKIYGRINDLDVRLARSKSDLKRAQRLRYHIFYEEMSAIPDALAMMSRRDEDPFDSICDHLLVVDHGATAKNLRPWPRRPRVVGTYRILRQDVAEMHDGFYSQGEYNITPLLEEKQRDLRFMEVGRSCVLKPYRNRRSVELLWKGLMAYAREHGYDVMIGCASFEGTDPRRHAEALSFLHSRALAPENWRVRAHDDVFVDMNMIPPAAIDERAALRGLPPIIKGYLRAGAYFGDGAVIDHQFNTTDVFVIMPLANINDRYLAHFDAPDEFARARGFAEQLN